MAPTVGTYLWFSLLPYLYPIYSCYSYYFTTKAEMEEHLQTVWEVFLP